MSNVVKVNFPQKPVMRVRLALAELREKSRSSSFDFAPFANAGLFIFNALRLPFFLFFYWLRGPIVGVLNVGSMLAFFAFLISLAIAPAGREHMTWLLAGFSFIAFGMSYFYDSLLFALSPVEMMRTL